MINKESLARASELDIIAKNNQKNKDAVATGTSQKYLELYEFNKKKILKYFKANNKDWETYTWQMANRISDAKTLNEIFELDIRQYEEIEAVSKKYRWAISPYYLALVDMSNKFDPIGLMCLPNALEASAEGESDPMAEEYTNPAGSITRRYPDRLIINITNVCGMYCRFCQRKRNIGEIDSHQNQLLVDESIKYIEENPTIRDVLITGGDPFTLPTKLLEATLIKLRKIKHLEIIRIGTRIPVTLPQRVDKKLVDMLKKYHPLYINVQFNHPREVTPSTIKACNMLANAGIPLGNQAVLLNGINNDKYIMLKLNQELLKIRVKPYYIFQAKKVKGTTHFNCDINDGIEIINFLRGNTSGMAIPTYIVNTPGGLGKVSLLKKNYEFLDDYNVKLTTWEGKEVIYPNHKTTPISTKYEEEVR